MNCPVKPMTLSCFDAASIFVMLDRPIPWRLPIEETFQIALNASRNSIDNGLVTDLSGRWNCVTLGSTHGQEDPHSTQQLTLYQLRLYDETHGPPPVITTASCPWSIPNKERVTTTAVILNGHEMAVPVFTDDEANQLDGHKGPLIIADKHTTVLVQPNWSISGDEHGHLHLKRHEA